jgi:tetratricopeptide (TPR) repeat protein
MIYEILIIISAVAIFIILARRIPEHDESLTLDKNGQSFSLSGLRIGEKFSKIFSHLKFKLPKKPNYRKQPDTTQLGQVVSNTSVRDLISEAEQLLKSGDLRNAEKLYIKAASKDPKNPKIYSHLGTIYLQQKSFTDARDAFLAALKIDDSVASRHYNLGLAYIGLKTNEKAKVSLKKALQLDPQNKKYEDILVDVNKESQA